MMLPLAAYEVAVIDHTYFVHVHVLRCHSWCFDIRQVLSGIRDKHGHSLDEVLQLYWGALAILSTLQVYTYACCVPQNIGA